VSELWVASWCECVQGGCWCGGRRDWGGGMKREELG